ncbi:hypothetical protein [Aquimarina sp. RZ0]|nr:hypothetical protein [Aquimarina sp. RZ0]
MKKNNLKKRASNQEINKKENMVNLEELFFGETFHQTTEMKMKNNKNPL